MDDQIEAVIARCGGVWVTEFTGSAAAYRRTQSLVRDFGRDAVIATFTYIGEKQIVPTKSPVGLARTLCKMTAQETA